MDLTLFEARDREAKRLTPDLSRGTIVALVAATVLAGGLRLLNLEQWSFWVDEAHSYRDATLPFDGEDGFRQSGRAGYPVSYLLLRWYIDGLGLLGEGWLRLPFAFIGTLTVPLLALVARPLVGTRVALAAAFLLAVHPWHIYWSQNVRSYVLVGFIGLIAMGLVWRAFHFGGWMAWAGATVVLLLAGFTHQSAFGLLVAVAAFVALTRMERETLDSPRLWAWVAGSALGVFALLQVAHWSETFQIFARAKPDASLLHLVETSAFYFRVPVLLAAVVGLWFLTIPRDRTPLLFLGAWVLVPAVGLALFGSLYVKATARYAFFALPAVLVLSSVAVIRFWDLVWAAFADRPQWVRCLPAGLLPGLLLVDSLAYDVLYHTVSHGDRPRWREAAAWVAKDTGSGTARIFSTNEPTLIYYVDKGFWRRVGDVADDGAVPVRMPVEVFGLEPWAYPKWGGPVGFIEELIEQDRRSGGYRGPGLYAVVTQPELAEMDPDGSLERYLRQTFQQTATFRAWVGPKDHTVYVFAYRGR